MEELREKYEEAVFRFRLLEKKEPAEKIEKARLIYVSFIAFIDDKYPLHSLGDDQIIDVLRNYRAEQYSYRMVNGKIEFPANDEKGSTTVGKAHIDETLNAISYREKLLDEILYYESDLAFQKIQEQVKQIPDIEEQIEFLTDFKYGEEVKVMPYPERIKRLIDETIEKLKKGGENTGASESQLKMAPRFKTNLVELIDALHDDKKILDKRTDAPVNLQTLINHFEALFDTDLSEYYNIRRDAFLTYKRSVEGSSYFKRLDKLQKLKIEELKSKDR